MSYTRMYVGPNPLDVEGFAVIGCDHDGCDAVVAAPFRTSNPHPLAMAVDVATQAGWENYQDDRCPQHTRPVLTAIALGLVTP